MINLENSIAQHKLSAEDAAVHARTDAFHHKWAANIAQSADSVAMNKLSRLENANGPEFIAEAEEQSRAQLAARATLERTVEIGGTNYRNNKDSYRDAALADAAEQGVEINTDSDQK